MAGIYVHIPFCKQACHYCDFHFSTSLKLKNDFLKALFHEIEMQKDYLGGKSVSSVYLGGGTPSLLNGDELNRLFEQLHRFFSIEADAECTIEANPDDLSSDKIRDFRQTPINRFSIGIQSFIERDLKFMNRAHDSQQAANCVPMVQEAGFENITIDLIYGTPGLSNEEWLDNLAKAHQLQIPHLSAYCLTVESNTALAHFIKEKKVAAPDNQQAGEQMTLLMQQAPLYGWEQYEVSNFARPDFRARHNSSYWLGKSYLGLGPSAHSFNGQTRQWNVANNGKYIRAISAGNLLKEVEELSQSDRFNEYLMISLRTIWGVDLDYVEAHFGLVYRQDLEKQIPVYIQSGQAIQQAQHFRLKPTGFLQADRISSDLFVLADL